MKKKLSTLVLALMLVFSFVPTAMALPSNTVVIGSQAFAMDLFFEDPLPDEILAALISGGDIYYDAGTGFVNAWTGDSMSESVKDSLNNISYMNADGSVSVYENFDDTQPVASKKAIGKVEIATIGTVSIARVYVNSSEVGTQFRLSGGTATSFGEYVQLNATAGQTASLELLDSAGNLVGTISVNIVAGSFEAGIQETSTSDDEFIVESIY